jgi:hypothetical protein
MDGEILVINEKVNGEINKKANNNGGDDLWSLFSGVVKKINIKMSIMIFVIFIILNITSITKLLLAPFTGVFENDIITNKGILIQGLILVIMYIILDMLINLGYI